jgi:aspartate/methionine/tyrosine aminotransferase
VLASTAAFHLAERFDEVGFSDIVQIRNRVMELRAQGAAVYQFEGGEPFRPTPDYIKAAATAALSENKTRYAPSSGIPELRQAIADKLRARNRINVGQESIMVVNGGMQGLFAAFQSVVNPGDEVLVFSPYWTPIKDLISYSQGRIVLVPTLEARANGFRENLELY